jgi:hypothetical protein
MELSRKKIKVNSLFCLSQAKGLARPIAKAR